MSVPLMYYSQLQYYTHGSVNHFVVVINSELVSCNVSKYFVFYVICCQTQVEPFQ